MATSTLDPDYTPEPDRRLTLGHDTDALGPSDLSDTGSDVQGGFRAIESELLGLGLDRGTTEDSDSRYLPASPEDSDSTGTGESTTAGRNLDAEMAGDIDVDRIDSIDSPDVPDMPDIDPDDDDGEA